MIKYKFIAFMASGFMLFSCSSPEVKSETTKSEKTKNTEKSIETTEDKELSRIVKRGKLIEQNRLDSIRREDALNEILSKIDFKSSFKESFEVSPDSLYELSIKVNYDYHFSNRKRHLIVHRVGGGKTEIDIFTKSNDDLDRILSHEQWDIEYTGDSLFDVNGDGQKDFVVKWYGSTGCCLKAHAEVYVMRPDLKSFSTATHFINPTFSPRERIIRGVCYGHPGETELYKLKWFGEKVDTIEYVSFERDENGKRTGSVIISNQYPSHKDYKITRKVFGVPKEYESIEGYTWFTAELNRP